MPEVTYTCNVCGTTFNDQNSLAHHMVTNHAQKTEVVREGEPK